MDWELFLKLYLSDVNVKRALGVLLTAAVALIPGIDNEVKVSVVALIISALLLWAGAQNAKEEHDFEIELCTKDSTK